MERHEEEEMDLMMMIMVVMMRSVRWGWEKEVQGSMAMDLMN